MKKTFYKIETDLGQLYIDKDEFEDIKYRVNNVAPWNTDVEGNPVRFHQEVQEFPSETIIVGSTRLTGKKITELDRFKEKFIEQVNDLRNLRGISSQTKLVLNELLKDIV